MKKGFQQLKKLKGAFGVSLLLVSTFTYAMFQGGFVSWFMFYMVIPLTIYSLLLFIYPLAKMEVERKIDTREVYSGGRFSATIHVKRNNRFPLMYVSFEERVSGSLRQSMKWKKITFLGWKKEYKWNYTFAHMPRGEHELEGIIIQVSDLFGWVRKEAFIPNKKVVLVLPNLTHMIYIPIESRYDQGAAVSRIQSMKDTSMATGVRSYQPGDRVSWIHWKSFARNQTLKTKEFEERQSQNQFVIIDRTPSALFEEVVDLTASIMQAIVRHQASSGFLSIGKTRTYIPTVQNEEQYRRVLYHLTMVQADLEKSMEHVILNDLSTIRGTTLIYITSNLSYEWIDQLHKSANNVRVCTCFVVKHKDRKLANDENLVHQYAASRGIDVHVLTKDRFAQAFLEVNHS